MAELARIPPVTRFLVVSTVVISLSCLVSLISPYSIALHWPRTLTRLQLWRPLTTFFYGDRGLPLLFNIFCLYRMSSSLETQSFFGGSAAYAWTVLVIAGLILAGNAVTVGTTILFKPLLSALIYLWARDNPTSKVTLFGLVNVPARVYPLVLVCLDIVQTSSLQGAFPAILGVMVGHFWWFISSYLPTRAPVHLRRSNRLAMPEWFQALFNQYAQPAARNQTTSGITRVVGNSQQRQGPQAGTTLRHRWGSGQRLGAE